MKFLSLYSFLVIWCSVSSFDGCNPTKRSASNCSDDHKYSIVSHTIDGIRECMSDCINGYCRTSWDGCDPCIPGYQRSYTYYTSRYKQPNYSKCLSRCGNYGDEYTWCIVDNKNRKWDYCNDQTEKRQITAAFSSRFGPCRTDCDTYDEKYLWCYTWWDGLENWDYCDQQKITFEQVKTVYGRECRVECKKRENKNHFWCYDTARQARLCAPAADYGN